MRINLRDRWLFHAEHTSLRHLNSIVLTIGTIVSSREASTCFTHPPCKLVIVTTLTSPVLGLVS